MQVAVIGAGAVGCYYGGQLLRTGHDVTFIGRQPHVDAINAHGLLLETQAFEGRLPAKAAIDSTSLAHPDLVLFWSSRPIPRTRVDLYPGRWVLEHQLLVYRTAWTIRNACAR